MLERDRLESKKISKTQAVTSQIDRDMGAGNVHIGPSDYVPWLDDRKWAYVRLEGRAFGDVPLSPGVQARGLGLPQLRRRHHRRRPRRQDRPGPRHRRPILSASSYFMKTPPEQYDDSQARDDVEAFIRGDIER